MSNGVAHNFMLEFNFEFCRNSIIFFNLLIYDPKPVDLHLKEINKRILSLHQVRKLYQRLCKLICHEPRNDNK